MSINKSYAEFGYYEDSAGFERVYDSKEFPNPIPLTEEWLERLGFERSKSIAGMLEISATNYISILSTGTITVITHKHGGFSKIHVSCYTVHKLQNLYFALTGEELKLKP